MVIDIDELVGGTVKLVSIPDIVHQLDHAINDPYSDMADIAEIIACDPALAARILKIANSALFNFPAQIETVTYAASIIGTKQLRDLVFATCVIDVFKSAFKPDVDLASFWHHSIVAGITARVIATYRREANIERFYLLGLMHDLGKLVLHMGAPEQARESIYDSEVNNRLLCESEQQLFGFDHGQVGGALLKHWNLPEILYEPIMYHHNPQLAQSYPAECAIVHLADIISNSLAPLNSHHIVVPPLSPQAWDQIGISEHSLATLVGHVELQYQDSCQILLSS